MPITPPTNAKAGHGATVAMELDPAGMQGIFTVIAEQGMDLTWPDVSRPVTDVTIHTRNIDSSVLGVPTRGPMSFGCNFVFNDQTHDHLTGVYAKFWANTMTGWRMRGPGGSASTDEWICSGQVEKIGKKDPVRTGVRSMDVTVRMSGPQIIDGVTFGT